MKALRSPLVMVGWAAWGLVACTGTIEGTPGDEPAGPAPGPGGGPPGEARPPAPPAGPMLPPPAEAPAVCDTRLKPATPARLRRLTAAQYESSVRALLGRRPAAGLTNPFDDDAGAARFSTLADAAGVPQQTLGLLLDAADRIADELAPVLRGQNACLAAASLDRACVERVIGAVGASAFRRPLTSEELGRFAGLVLAEQAAAGADLALRLGLSALLSSPRFTFLWELGAGAPDAAGRVRLGPHEVAAALSYAVTEGPPDAMLTAAAARNELATPAQIRAHVERLLGPAGDQASVRRFVAEYLRYTKAPDVFKDPKLYPHHRGPELVDDTERFVRDTVAGRKGFLATLLTAPTGFARADTARSYGIEVPSKSPVPVTFPAGERAGILTHPSFLVAHSHNEENDPIGRGRFVSESLLCRPVPDLALPEVPEPPALPNSTFRERLKAHAEKPQCAGCHSLMDPLGFAFEQYDHTGRYRTMEAGKPVDASGTLTSAGSADGPFRNAVELAGRLARSPVVEECFTRHALRYWLGRLETAADGCTVAAARAAYARGGGDVLQMFAEILSSESFLYRIPLAK